MQIHELNTFYGSPGETDFLAIDTGFDTAKIGADKFVKQNGYGSAGQLLRTDGNGSTEWVDEGLPTDAQTAQAVSDWLDAHPEATTTVQDGAITRGKINSGLLPYILNGEAYTITDINGDLGAKVNAALAAHDVVIVPTGNYILEEPIVISSDYKTLVVLGNITYNGNDYAIELYNCRFCKVFVNMVESLTASCIKVQADSGLCQLSEIHSMHLNGKICIDINATGTGTSGVQHINFYSNYIRAIEKGISLTSTGSCWCGEIKFFGGEINGTNATGVYTNGYNTAIRAFGLGFESLAELMNLNDRNYECSFYGCRGEQAGNIVLSGTLIGFIFEGLQIFPSRSLDISGLTDVGSAVIRGAIFSDDGNIVGTEYEISPNFVGYVSQGRGKESAEYRYINDSNGGEIGGALTNGICPHIARITSTGTFTLSRSYGLLGIPELIIYAEKSGITVKNYDGTKTLFTTNTAQSVWRITGAAVNGYFSPSGYIVEKLTPVT